jgi:hypothetical protein
VTERPGAAATAAEPAPASTVVAPLAAAPFVVVGGDAAFCEGDVCTVPTPPAGAVPLATPPTT